MSVTSLNVSASNPISDYDLQKVLDKLGHKLKPEEEPDYLVLLQALDESVESVMNLPDYEPTSDIERFPRKNVNYPKPEENTHGGWAWKCTIQDTKLNNGPLSGRTIVIKDNIAVSGVDCLLGTSMFTGWKPTADATVVTRILEAGGTITGKAVCENLSLGATSFSAATGPVHNPFARGYSTGGSSSGCGLLIASGEADMGMGGDQGGSVRIPASWCGLFGFKPTFGLVPYTGIAPLEPTIDHTGPMTRTCLDNAILLKSIAGRDDLDDRCAGAPLPSELPDYPGTLFAMKDADMPLKGFKIGMVKEGFDICKKGGLNDPRVGVKVQEASEKWRELGAVVEDVSIPMHDLGATLWVCIARMGSLPVLWGGMSGRSGYQMTELTKKMHNIRTEEGWDNTPWSPKNMILNGTYLWDKHPELYGKAINQIRRLRATYNEALSRYNVLVMPTIPYLPTTHAPPEASVLEKVSRSLGQIFNTSPFNATGHPSLSMYVPTPFFAKFIITPGSCSRINICRPVGMLPAREDKNIQFPVGLQITGRHMDEMSIYKAAFAWEAKFDWKEL
ncbi:amidase signature enzyme [Lentinula aff. detonsa]|uniref:Amidase signature enzyme n=1 Tax=Lentinula aff. detonsa TaxID=2804958 RepID=A0AA38L4X2_9AGAR|nr:amidase signature enzyme [Lentinula aff. detonsa]